MEKNVTQREARRSGFWWRRNKAGTLSLCKVWYKVAEACNLTTEKKKSQNAYLSASLPGSVDTHRDGAQLKEGYVTNLT